jgi:predicted GH43/DUF377 family glycosyl hydrolase
MGVNFFFISAEKLDVRLEGLAQEAIVQTKQIRIPGFAKAFNPSLISYPEGYLLSFRIRHRMVSSQSRKKDVSFIGVVKLDNEFRVRAQTAQQLEITSYASHASSTAEDARLFFLDDRVFCIFNDFPPSNKEGCSLYCAELVENAGKFVFKEPAKPLLYERAIPIEKNWSPFVAGGKLHLIYSDAPRVILEVNVDSGHCTELARSACHWDWRWGEIRGGTPAVSIGNGFLTFFHSSLPAKKGRLYAMGAYVFDSHFPFLPHAVSPIPLGKKEDYTRENRHNVVFPGGLVVQEDQIHVAWGKNNKQICVTTFDKQKLIDSLYRK